MDALHIAASGIGVIAMASGLYSYRQATRWARNSSEGALVPGTEKTNPYAGVKRYLIWRLRVVGFIAALGGACVLIYGVSGVNLLAPH